MRVFGKTRYRIANGCKFKNKTKQYMKTVNYYRQWKPSTLLNGKKRLDDE